MRHWKWWLPQFIATGCTNYSTEAANLIANLSADFPKHISYIITHNRTVNTKGKAGHGKPLDHMIEHYNLYVYTIQELQLTLYTTVFDTFCSMQDVQADPEISGW